MTILLFLPVLLMTYYDVAPPGFFGLVLLLTNEAVSDAG
jgi:hypothetical protein